MDRWVRKARCTARRARSVRIRWVLMVRRGRRNGRTGRWDRRARRTVHHTSPIGCRVAQMVRMARRRPQTARRGAHQACRTSRTVRLVQRVLKGRRVPMVQRVPTAQREFPSGRRSCRRPAPMRSGRPERREAGRRRRRSARLGETRDTEEVDLRVLRVRTVPMVRSCGVDHSVAHRDTQGSGRRRNRMVGSRTRPTPPRVRNRPAGRWVLAAWVLVARRPAVRSLHS